MPNRQKTINSLKQTARQREGQITLRLGVRKVVVPITVGVLTSDEHVYLHIKPFAEMMSDDGRRLTVMTDDAEVEAAAKGLRKQLRKTRAKATVAPIEMPEELKAALARIPTGYKLAFSPDGGVRMIKARVKRSKNYAA